MILSIALLALFATYDVGPFAKPSPEKEFASLKMPGGLRTPRENWEHARKLAASDPAWTQWLAARRAEVDDWIAKRRDRVEWVAGWWHDFVDAKDGAFLTWTPDEPPEYARLPKVHGGWVFGFRSRHTEKVWEAARLYRLTGERKYADWAASQLDFYAENYLKWPLQGRGGARLMYQSLDDANVVVRLVNAARLLEGFASPEQRERWIARLFRPEAQLLDESMQRIHNIACWQRSAQAQVAMYARDDELWKRAIDGPFGVRKQIEHGITSEYLWFEQSLLYNAYVVSALMPLFTMAALEGRANELAAEMHSAENMMLAPIMLRFPTGQLPNPADATTGLKKAPNLALLASAYRLFPTRLGLAEAAKLRSWDTLLDPPEPASPGSSLPPAEARDWSTSRMAVIQGGGWQVYLHYGQIHASHAQSEALNYEAFYGDTDVTHDPGTVGYGSPLHSGFYRTGAAHNVPLANGEAQARWDPGELTSFAPTRVAARQPRYRPGVIAARELRIERKTLIDTVTVEAEEEKSLGLTLHLQGRIGAKAEAVGAPLPHWADTRRARYTDRAAFPVTFANGKKMNVTVELAGPFTITFGRSPDVPPDQRDSLYIETTGRKAVITTRLEPQW